MHLPTAWRAQARTLSTSLARRRLPAAASALALVAAALVAVTTGSVPAAAQAPAQAQSSQSGREYKVLVFTKATAENARVDQGRRGRDRAARPGAPVHRRR